MITKQFIPALEKLDKLRDENSELSDEYATLSVKLDEREKEMKDEKEKLRVQMVALATEREKRVKELDLKIKQRDATNNTLQSNYKNLYKEHAELKSKFVEHEKQISSNSDDAERYKKMLSALKNLVSKITISPS